MAGRKGTCAAGLLLKNVPGITKSVNGVISWWATQLVLPVSVNEHMALSHYEVVLRCEASLIASLIAGNGETILSFCHPDIVFTNEVGKMACGVRSLLVFRPEILRFDTIEILERDIRFFDSVAVVNSREKRSGSYLGLAFSNEYHLIRVWKFTKGWKLIAAATMIP